jgi:hypothetical protein
VSKSIRAGERYGDWLVLAELGKRSRHYFARCRCSCGTEREIQTNNLRNGISKRCRPCSIAATNKLRTKGGKFARVAKPSRPPPTSPRGANRLPRSAELAGRDYSPPPPPRELAGERHRSPATYVAPELAGARYQAPDKPPPELAGAYREAPSPAAKPTQRPSVPRPSVPPAWFVLAVAVDDILSRIRVELDAQVTWRWR